MFSPQKANLKIGEVTAAGLVKLFKPGVKQPARPGAVERGTHVRGDQVGDLRPQQAHHLDRRLRIGNADVDVQRENGHLEMRVRDTGIGIAESFIVDVAADQAHVFFHRRASCRRRRAVVPEGAA